MLETLLETEFGKLLAAAAVSMVPVVELRGGIPFAILTLGLHPLKAYLACIIGNLIPVPLIIVYIRRIFLWTRRRFPRLGRVVDALEKKAHLKGRKVLKYRYFLWRFPCRGPAAGRGLWLRRF